MSHPSAHQLNKLGQAVDRFRTFMSSTAVTHTSSLGTQHGGTLPPFVLIGISGPGFTQGSVPGTGGYAYSYQVYTPAADGSLEAEDPPRFYNYQHTVADDSFPSKELNEPNGTPLLTNGEFSRFHLAYIGPNDTLYFFAPSRSTEGRLEVFTAVQKVWLRRYRVGGDITLGETYPIIRVEVHAQDYLIPQGIATFTQTLDDKGCICLKTATDSLKLTEKSANVLLIP